MMRYSVLLVAAISWVPALAFVLHPHHTTYASRRDKGDHKRHQRLQRSINAVLQTIQQSNKASIPIIFKSSISLEASANPLNVDRVSVCMGELCKCQEENAETILSNLLSRDLPYTVEDSPCLGACGIGAMVSIEYEDGDYALVMGLQETLHAVGIVSDVRAGAGDVTTSTTMDIGEEIHDELLRGNTVVDSGGNTSMSKSATTQAGVVSPIVKDAEVNKPVTIANADGIMNQPNSINDASNLDSGNERMIQTVAIVEDHGAVDRMRAESAKAENERSNPWVNMAVYLAQKAKDSILG